eukprot:6467655-Amphidinium_carterae.1
MEKLIHALFLADNLRSAEKLRAVLEAACRYVLPERTAAAVVQHANELPVPGKAELSRLRFKVDVAFMLHMRHLNNTLGSASRYLMLDSSPQFHRDYEQVLEKVIYDRDLIQLWVWSRRLENMWTGQFDQDAFNVDRVRELLEEEALLLDNMNTKIHWHTLPPVLVGFGVSDLGRKMHATLHSLRLETATHEDFHRCCNEVVCLLSDQGTEFGIGP